jgi:RNA polymerase sigma factor (sigma-70 family)
MAKYRRTDPYEVFRENTTWATAVARGVWRKLPEGFDIEDLVQEANLAMWKKAKQWDPRKNSSFQGFAMTYVRGAVLMKCRRNAWFNATLVQSTPTPAMSDGSANPLEERPDTGEAPEVTANRERGERLYVAERLAAAHLLDVLPLNERHVFERCYLDGVSSDRVAQEMGEEKAKLARILSSAVRRMARARKRAEG